MAGNRPQSIDRFCLSSPVRRLDSSQTSGGLGEDCLSTQCEFRSPACLRTIEGTPQGRQTGVAFFLVTFSLAKQEKVTSCRATPGGFVLGPRSMGIASLNPSYKFCPRRFLIWVRHARKTYSERITLLPLPQPSDKTTSHSTKLPKDGS